MDDAADLAAVLGAHRHNIAAVAQRNDCVLQEFIGGGILDDIVEFGADGVLGRADTAAQIAQRNAGGVRHFLRRKDTVGDLLFQHRLRCQGKEEIVGGQRVMLCQAVPLDKALKIAQDGGNFQKLPHREDTAFGRMRHDAPSVLYRAETRAAVFDEQRIDRVGLRQGVALLLDRGKRRDGLHLRFGLLAGAQRHRPGDDLIQFQCFLKGKVHE